MEAEMNVAHYHTLINRSINRVFVGERRASGGRRAEDSFGHFLLENAEHPRMGVLFTCE